MGKRERCSIDGSVWELEKEKKKKKGWCKYHMHWPLMAQLTNAFRIHEFIRSIVDKAEFRKVKNRLVIVEINMVEEFTKCMEEDI